MCVVTETTIQLKRFSNNGVFVPLHVLTSVLIPSVGSAIWFTDNIYYVMLFYRLWAGHNKIAAVGVSASAWISSHGFALNVSPDLEYFDASVILPCGIEGRGVTSIEKVLQERGVLLHPTVEEVAQVALQSMEDVFQIQIDKNNHNRLT